MIKGDTPEFAFTFPVLCQMLTHAFNSLFLFDFIYFGLNGGNATCMNRQMREKL